MGDRGRRWPWLIASGCVASLLAVITVVAVRFGQDAVASVAEAAGLLVTVVGGSSAWALRRTRSMPPPSGPELDGAARALAVLVRDQWTEEATVRGLLDPGGLAVRWRGHQGDWGDYERVVGATLCGSSDDMVAFARGFRALPHRRLVILGGPGAGKTTLALLLVRELLEHPEPGDPVPVLLGLSTWNPQRETLTAWIAKRLRQDYPALGNHGVYGRFAVRRLIVERRVLPVLDGLDEMPRAQRPYALIALNRALSAGGPLVLTCRSTEFHRAVDASDVVTAAAVCVAEPVAAGDVIDYLADSASPRRAHAWEPVFAQLRDNPASPLATALTLPLNVWLARMVYNTPGADPAELTRIGEPGAIQDRLLDAFVPSVFTGPHGVPSTGMGDPRSEAAARWHPEEARRWLGFLAAHLRRQDSDELVWWQLDRAVPPGSVGPLTAPLVAVVFGCGGASLAAPYFTSAFSAAAVLAATVAVTAASAVAATAVMRVFGMSWRRSTEGTRPRPLALAAVGLLVVGLAIAVGCIIGRYGMQEPHTFVGRFYQVRSTPGTAWRAGVGWGAVICGFGALAAFVPAAATRRGRRAIRRNAHPLVSQAVSVLVFGADFWLGAECIGACVTLPILQRHSLWRQMCSVSEGATSSAALFLLVAGVVVGLRVAEPRAFPAYLRFRLRGRLREALGRLPAALGRGAALGTLLGFGWGLAFPDYPHTPALPTRLLVLTAFGLISGLLSGVGLALVRWARTPADADQATPLATLRGDRSLALAVLLISMLPLMGTWLLVALTANCIANHLYTAHPLLRDIAMVPEASLATGLAAGLISASSTAYFDYLEARIQLAAEHRLPRDLVQFLEDARLLRVLREIGAVYQFCHATLRDHLAAQYAQDIDTQRAAPVPPSRTQPSNQPRRAALDVENL